MQKDFGGFVSTRVGKFEHLISSTGFQVIGLVEVIGQSGDYEHALQPAQSSEPAMSGRIVVLMHTYRS